MYTYRQSRGKRLLGQSKGLMAWTSVCQSKLKYPNGNTTASMAVDSKVHNMFSQLDFVVHGSPNAASCMRIAAMVNLHVNFETVFTASKYAFLLSFYPRPRQFHVISVVMFVASCHWLRSYIASTKSLDLASPNPIISSQTLKHTPV